MNKKGAHGAASVVFSFLPSTVTQTLAALLLLLRPLKREILAAGKKKAAVMVQTAVPCVSTVRCVPVLRVMSSTSGAGESNTVSKQRLLRGINNSQRDQLIFRLPVYDVSPWTNVMTS